MVFLDNFIGGRPAPARSNERIDDTNPATGEVHAQIPRSRAQDVDDAVQAAKAALHGEWGQSTQEERATLLEAIADRLTERADEFARCESMDTGKPISLALNMDVHRAIANFRFFAGAIRHMREDFHPMATAFNYTTRRPVGVVGLITPWNLPLYLLTWKTAPAIAMGNTIVAKPSELTPWTATLLAEVFSEVGAPMGVFNLVHGYGPEAGQALVEHPEVGAVSFTGGTVTGRHVAATAAPLFKKLSLELGGKNPTIVFADADFDKAVKGATRSAFLNQGQICLCGSRLYVERPIYERFLQAMMKEVEELKIGPPDDSETRIGSLVSLDHRDKVESYLQLAKQEGGLIAYGGQRPSLDGAYAKGAFLEPTIITGLSNSCRTAQEEIFGPVVTLHPFDTEAEAIRMANSTQYGLSASVWTQDLGKAHRVSAAIDSGMVWVNTWLMRDLRVPFGGVKESGVGREGGHHSLEFFSESKNICIELGAPLPSPLQSSLSQENKPSPPEESLEPVTTPLKAIRVQERKPQTAETPASAPQEDTRIDVVTAPKPVGAYPHARREGEFLFLSGIGPRDPKTNGVPGGPIVNELGEPQEYDIRAQTEAVIQNVRIILEGAGSSLDKVIDVQVFLINMERDFQGFNEVYARWFRSIGATRTTVAVRALPTPIAVEFKIIARA